MRVGSAEKRKAILDAARELFISNTFDRTSMDAIAASATVSKRTIYDYFGGKENLLIAVLETASDALQESLEESLETHLSDKTSIQDAESLKRSLTNFAIEISTTLIGSNNYVTIFALTSGMRSEVPSLDKFQYSSKPEEAIARRIRHFHDRGLLDVPNPREAADHFIALTVLLAYSNQNDANRKTGKHQVQEIIAGGVRAFMRAYGNLR